MGPKQAPYWKIYQIENISHLYKTEICYCDILEDVKLSLPFSISRHEDVCGPVEV
jgi:hypothetical protein